MNMNKTNPINLTEFKLAVAVLNNITEELEHLFDRNKILDSYHYVSTLDDKYKELMGSYYTNDMRRCDVKIHVKPKITPWMKYKNKMEIVDQVSRDFAIIRPSKK